MADGRIEIDTKLDSKGAEKGISNLKSKLQGVGTKMKSVGGGMSTFMTAPLLASLGVATKGTEEFRGDLSKLEQNARDAGLGTDVVRDSMVRLSGVSNETDSNVEALSNLLATGFDKQGLTQTMDALSGAVIKFPDTLKIEGLADGLQETLATGKAIGPFAEMLDRLGINQDKFNQGLAEAKAKGEEQNYILQTLADSGLSKVNEGYRENNKELVKSQESQQKFQQTLADLGTTLQPIMTSVTNLFQKLIEKFNSLSPTAQKIVIVVAAIAAAIGPLLVVAGSLVTIIGAVGGAMLGWIALGAIVVVAIAALVIAIVTHWDTIKAKTLAIWGSVKEWLIGAWNGIKTTAITVFNAVKSFLLNIWTSIKTTVSNVVMGLVDSIQTAWSNFKSNTQGVFNALKQILSGIWTAIKNVVVGAVLLLVDLVTGDFQGLKEHAVAIFNNLKDAASNIWNGIKSLISNLVKILVNGVKTAWNGLKTATSKVWNAIKSSVSNIVSNLKSAVTEKFQALKNAVGEKMTAAKNKITEIWNSAKDFLENIDLFSIGADIINGLIRGIGSVAGDLWKKVKGIAGGIKDKLTGVLKIHSPSRVMRDEVGVHIVGGVIQGMENMERKLYKTSQGIANNAIPDVRMAKHPQTENNRMNGEMIGLLKKISDGIDKGQVIMMNDREVGRVLKPVMDELNDRSQINRMRARGLT